MQGVPHGGIEFHDDPAAVQVDEIVGPADFLADGVGRALGDRAVGTARAGAGQVQLVLGRALAAPIGGLVDYGDSGETAPQVRWIEVVQQAANGRHRLELVAVDAA